MIAQLSGEVIEKLDKAVILNVHGVGYEVLVTEKDAEDCVLGSTVKVHTYFHVREASQELFGFTSVGAKVLFKQLLSVNGVGPKSALSIMGLGSENHIKAAIGSSNIAFIKGASGVGKKAAEKVILELKDKVGVIAGVVVDQPMSQDDEAFEALQALGFPAAQAQQVLAEIDAELPVEVRVKEALKGLQR